MQDKYKIECYFIPKAVNSSLNHPLTTFKQIRPFEMMSADVTSFANTEGYQRPG